MDINNGFHKRSKLSKSFLSSIVKSSISIEFKMSIFRRLVLVLAFPFLLFGDQSVKVGNGFFSDHIKVNPIEKNVVGYLKIDRDRAIDRWTHLYVKFALDHFRKQGAIFVIMHLNTPGGEVMSSLKIVNLLENSDAEGMPVVAMIDNWAISAGALLAYSSRYIAATPVSSMGAAEPVMMSQDGKMETASEKITSALRSEFANTARYFGRNPLIAQAMVDRDLIVVERSGEIVALDSMEEKISSDIVISAKGKLLTLDGVQLEESGIADFMLNPKLKTGPSEAQLTEGTWSLDDMMLSQESFFAEIPNSEVITYSDWKVSFFSILLHPMVAAVLIMALMLGAYIELSTPGFGVAGIVALVALGLILLSSFAIQAVNWLEVIILIVGFVMLAIEIFVIPGFGVIGVIGLILIIAGLFSLMLPNISAFKFNWSPEATQLAIQEMLERLAYLSAGFLISLVAIIFLARFITRKTTLFSRLVLKGEQDAEAGYSAAQEALEKFPSAGSIGKAITPLCPAGKVSVEGKLYPASADSGFIDKERSIVVLRIDGSKLVVKEYNGK